MTPKSGRSVKIIKLIDRNAPFNYANMFKTPANKLLLLFNVRSRKIILCD